MMVEITKLTDSKYYACDSCDRLRIDCYALQLAYKRIFLCLDCLRKLYTLLDVNSEVNP